MSASHDSNIPAAAYLVAPAYLQQIARLAGYKSGFLRIREHSEREQDKTQTIMDVVGYKPGTDEYVGVQGPYTIGQLHFRQLPGNCGTVVMYYCRVYSSKNQEKIAALLLKMREHIARMARYSLMLATCTEDSPDFELLKAAEWEIAEKFVNSKTDRTCVLLMKTIVRAPRKQPILVKDFGGES